MTCGSLATSAKSTLNGTLVHLPIRGGKLVVAANFVGTEESLLVTGDSVVFAQSLPNSTVGSSGQIVRTDLQGGGATVLASGSSAQSYVFGSLATDGQNVYFAEQDGVRSVPLAGGAVRTLATHTGALAVVGSNVLIADSLAQGVFSVPIAGGPATTLATDPSGELGPVLSCGPNICWASAVPVALSQQGTGAIMQLSPSGSPATLAEDPLLYGVYRLFFDGTSFFATVMGGDGNIGDLVRLPAEGSPILNVGFGSGLAIDDECLYVSSIADGVYSVSKSYMGQLPP
jgi:hypothetical protein